MDARDRALARLTEMLMPAAALSIPCQRWCCAVATKPCTDDDGNVAPTCELRLDAARTELHSLLRVLFES